ncbi:MAG: hypothetical protein LBG52_01865 [Candidatus Peribacteria bacterium]|jgi:hypothetical protein|nr:hypothetical protein [Candidatus Peribacteria bacterium]
MIPFLKQLYLDKKQQIDDTLLYAKKLFDQKFQGACTALEKMTEQPLYRQDFSIFLTSFPR